MKIQECEKCGSLYNPETTPRCPACGPRYRKPGKKTEINDYRKEEIKSKRTLVNSFRRAETTKKEREKGKQIYSDRV